MDTEGWENVLLVGLLEATGVPNARIPKQMTEGERLEVEDMLR